MHGALAPRGRGAEPPNPAKMGVDIRGGYHYNMNVAFAIVAELAYAHV